VRNGADASGLIDDLAPLLALVEKPVATAPELTANLKAIYDAVRTLDLARYDTRDVMTSAPQIMTAAFDACMTLRNAIPDLAARGLLDPSAVSALRDVFRISRYGIDMLGESAIRNAKLRRGTLPRRAFSGRDHNTFVNPLFDTSENIPFRSGDVLLMRGLAHNSAAIARIGDVDTQFSHLAIIHIDDAGEHTVVESLIEDGAIINTLDHALNHGVGRAVLYRHKDSDLAARAARAIHARILATQTGKARHIPYDFSMRLKGRRRLFCSKLVRLAFEEASGGKVLLPAYKTRLDMKNRDFFRRIGVKANETFAPGDIDVDPGFDLVAEWRDYRATSRLRADDLIMDKLFEWMETEGFNFNETLLIRLISVFGRFASYLSKDAKQTLAHLMPRIPSNMKRRAIATVAMLHKTGEELIDPIMALEADYIKRTGLPLPPGAINEHLERLREVSNGHIGYLERTE